ncbi:MAG TPA: hypothetical protein VGG48_20295 [Rhizomicrobium sp.]|jgi:hypothetical protein
MGLVIRAAIAFGIAFAIRSPQEFAAWARNPVLGQVKTEIAAEHPIKKLWVQFTDRDSRFDTH